MISRIEYRQSCGSPTLEFRSQPCFRPYHRAWTNETRASLTPETQEEILRQAIHLLKSFKPREVADLLEVSKNAVYEWMMVPKGKAESVNINSTVTNNGKLRFMIYDCSFNSQTFKKFLTRLGRASPKKIHLIVDNLGVHHSKLVKA